MTLEPLPTLLFSAAAGLALGSFAVTAGVRIGQGRNVLKGRSQCDHCGVALSYGQTIPLVSFWRLRGACGRCAKPIDPIHLLGELSGAALLIGAVFINDPLRAGFVAVLGLILIASAAVDWTTRRLPDALTLAIGVFAAALAWRTSVEALLTGLAAAALTVIALQVLRLWSRRGGRDVGLGLGDVKLMAALAVWLGLATPWMIAGASMLGLILMWRFRPTDGRLAFGPAIAITALGVGLGGEWGWWPTTA